MLGALQALGGAHDADVVPHEAAQFLPVVRDDDFLVGVRDPAFVPLGQRGPLPFRLGKNILDRGFREDQAFEQRVAGQPVGAVQAGAGGLAGGVEAGNVGARVQVGDDAAAGVVRRRDDRDGVAGDVDAQFGAARQDVREVLPQEFRRLVRDVEVHAIQAALLHLEVDGAGDDVARREFGARIVFRHEARAVGQLQQAAFAAHGLGDQEGLGLRVVEAGRVELDEFHVGDPAAGPPGHGDAVAGRGVRARRVEVDLARAARGDQGVRRADGDHLALGVVQGVGAVAAVFRQPQFFAGDQVDGDVVFEHRDVGMLADDVGQRLLYGEARRVGDVDHPARAVAAFAGQVVAGLVARELDALFDEPVDGPLAVLDDEAGGRGIVEVRAGDEGVADVVLDRILAVQHGGDAALGPGRGAVVQRAFADQADLAELGEADGRRLPGEAAPDYENVEVKRHVRIPLREKKPGKYSTDAPAPARVRCDTIRPGGSPRIAGW